MLFLFILITEGCMLLNLLQEVCPLYYCDMFATFLPVHWMILSLLWSIFFSIRINVAGIVFAILQEWLLCMVVKWFLSLHFIDWILTCLNLCVVTLHLNYCSAYVIGCLYDFEMIITIYPVYCLIHFFLRSVCFFFSFVLL